MAESRPIRSTVWSHFKRMEKKAKCRYCKLDVAISAGSTSNLRRHLLKLHPTVVIDSERPRSRSSSPSSTAEQPSLLATILTNRQSNMMATTTSLHARRTSSYHWNHFIRLDFTKAKCLYCHRVIKMSRGSTGNLNRHIRLKHPSIVKNHSTPVPPPSIPEYVPESPENIPGDVEVRIHEDDNEESGSEDQSTCDRFVIQPNTSVSQPSTALQTPEKRQRMTFDIVRKGNSQQNKDEDEFAVMGKHIANKLRKLSPEALPVVEKLITDVVFEAQCGNVSHTSRIAFYDMKNANLRNLQQANPNNKTQQDSNDTFMKTENPSSMSPNIVLLLPQSDVAKTLPLNVQVVQAKPEVQNKMGEPVTQPNDSQVNHRMIIN